MSKGFFFLVVLFFLPAILFAQGYGSKSMLHVQTASTLKPQRLDVRSNMRFWTKVGDYLGQNKPPDFDAVNYWLVQSNVLMSYGIAEHFDATFMAEVYQDVHSGDEANVPGDLYLDFKAGSFELSNNRLNVGGQFSMRFPTGKYHNYPFEPYTAGSLEFGMFGLFSYYNDPFLPHRDFSFHANLGWYYHNDAGQVLIEGDPSINKVEQKSQSNASALRYGLGFVYPTEMFDLNLELWGNVFLQEPDSFAFSRENYIYMTPSIRFRPKWWVSFDLGMDVRLSSNSNTTANQITFTGEGALDLPNYPAWRMHLGMNFVITPGQDRLKGGVGDQGDVRNKVDFYEKLLRERERTRSIEEELRRLKREREQAEKELEELRQLLEEEGK